MNRDIIFKELKKIEESNNGLLRPEDIVEVARNKSSPLHSQFNWDDSEAAHLYRIWQARKLIVTVLVTIPDISSKPIPGFVSLKNDRQSKGGGYRYIVKVLSDKDRKRQLLEDAKKEMELFISKYQMLTDLTNVVYSMRQVLKAKPNKKVKSFKSVDRKANLRKRLVTNLQ